MTWLGLVRSTDSGDIGGVAFKSCVNLNAQTLYNPWLMALASVTAKDTDNDNCQSSTLLRAGGGGVVRIY